MSFDTGKAVCARDLIDGTENRTVQDSLQVLNPPPQMGGSGTYVDTYVKPGAELNEKIQDSIQFFGAVPPEAADLIRAFNERPRQPGTHQDDGKTEQTRISFRVRLADCTRYHTLQDIKHYTLPEVTKVKDLIKKIKDDLDIYVELRLTNDKLKSPINPDKNLKEVGIGSGQVVYAFQDNQVTSVGQSIGSAAQH